jgi:fused signal recognition particle receptor
MIIAIIAAVVFVVVVATALIFITRSRRGRPGSETTPRQAPRTTEKPPPKAKTAPKQPKPNAAPKPDTDTEVAAKADAVLDEPEAPIAEPEFELQLEPELEPGPEPEALAPAPTYRSRLGNVRGLFSGAVSSLRSGKIDSSTWESLEEALIRADVGVATTDALLSSLRQRVEKKEIAGGQDLLSALGDEIRALLDTADSRDLRFDGKPGEPDVWLVVGVNGVGKTTTIGKLSRQQVALGRSVLLTSWVPGPNGPGSTLCAAPKGEIPVPSCSMRSSAPPPAATTWSWPTRPAGCTTRPTWSKS